MFIGITYLGAFAKLWSVVMPCYFWRCLLVTFVGPSTWTTRLHPDGFSWNL